MFSFLKRFFDPSKAILKEVKPIVEDILSREETYKSQDIAEIKARVTAIREELTPFINAIPDSEKTSLKTVKSTNLSEAELKLQKKLQEFLPEIFAMMREVNRRKFGKPHYDVQLMAATILAKGHKLTEVKTGEGKTQVFHLPAALYGLTGRGSHVITVNDYLARRDGEHAGHAMSDLGISVGIITPQAAYKFVPDDMLESVKGPEAAEERHNINPSKMNDMKGVNLIEVPKQEAYLQDVVYGTNNEFGFDYLRDNMVFDNSRRVQRELYFCIIDEADSILVDEARTPLIISSAAGKSNDMYAKFAGIVRSLNAESDYTVDEKSHSASLTETGVEKVQQMLGTTNLWENYLYAHHINNALRAESLYKNDEEYIVRNGEIMIVDEFTGRVLEGRRYSDGLHQAIEAKEGVEIKRESRTMATITFQNFFRLYKFLAGGSGTVMTESEEFLSIYNLEAIEVPTFRPIAREDRVDKVYKNKLAKFNAVAAEIEKIHETQQPILVGTTSIEASEFLSRLLDKKGIKHEVLNAKFHERESQIVANAGQKGAVTVATNMAGRGTDIVLGEGVKELGGLYIIGTERHDSRRIDNQLRGRAGRQGDPGVSQFFVALDDEIMRIQGGEIVQSMMNMVNLPDDFPIENSMIGSSITRAQKKMEGHHFDTRKRLVEYDGVVNQQREIFYTRRHQILELAKNATAELPEKKESFDQMKAVLQEFLENEVRNITVSHYVSERSDELDLDLLIKEYIDIVGPDVTIQLGGDDAVSSVKKLVADQTQAEVESKLIQLTFDLLDKKLEEFGPNLPELYKITSLQSLDNLWTEHLSAMADLRDGIGLRGYAQLNPLIEYKNEGFRLFEEFIAGANSQIARRILKIKRVENAKPIAEKIVTNEAEVTDVLTGSREMATTQQKKSAPVKSSSASVGRNDLCPCGSGLKYKKCGMINAPGHKN